MKRITFVLIGMVAIIAYLVTSTTTKIEAKVAQTDQVTIKKQHSKFIYD